MSVQFRPYHLFAVAALIFFVVGLFTGPQTIDIHLHDTDYVIGYSTACFYLSTLGLIFWTIYLLFRNLLFHPALTWAHVIVTIVFLSVLFGISQRSTSGTLVPRSYIDIQSLRRQAIVWNSLALVFLMVKFCFPAQPGRRKYPAIGPAAHNRGCCAMPSFIKFISFLNQTGTAQSPGR